MNADYHVHTCFSDDSTYDINQCVQDAIDLQLDEICFCDHVDYGVKLDHHTTSHLTNPQPKFNVDYEQYLKQVQQLQKQYQNQIKLKLGLEFGVQTTTIDRYNQLFQRLPLDFVILSIHQINNQEFHTNAFQQGKSEYEIYQAYYEELYQVVQNYHHYCVLGHMDLIKRYDFKDNYPSFTNHKAIITKILKYIIKDGKGIEVSTSSFRYQVNDLTPSIDILKLYKQLGGTIITLGSDSHCAKHLKNNHFDEIKTILKELGFEYFCTFEQMQPCFHKL